PGLVPHPQRPGGGPEGCEGGDAGLVQVTRPLAAPEDQQPEAVAAWRRRRGEHLGAYRVPGMDRPAERKEWRPPPEPDTDAGGDPAEVAVRRPGDRVLLQQDDGHPAAAGRQHIRDRSIPPHPDHETRPHPPEEPERPPAPPRQRGRSQHRAAQAAAADLPARQEMQRPPRGRDEVRLETARAAGERDAEPARDQRRAEGQSREDVPASAAARDQDVEALVGPRTAHPDSRATPRSTPSSASEMIMAEPP